MSEETKTAPTTESQSPGEALETAPLSIDALSKLTALVLVLVYVSGFLITSLNDFRYGFSEMNPLRPRIIAAGGWFGLFLAVPFAMVKQWTRHSLWKQNLSKWHKAALLLYVYYALCQFLMVYSTYIFAFDETKGPPVPTPATWKIVLAILFILIAIVLVGAYYSRLPRWLVATSIFLFLGWIIWSAYSSMFVKHTFQRDAPTLWMLGAGALVYLEMRDRAWKPKLGYWPRTLVVLLFILTVFATVYYPHIMSKWGGGAPLSVAITLSKDAPDHGGQVVACSLIDETDSGFYVIGSGDRHATFIPRAEVSLVHFADRNEPSVFNTQK